MHLGLDQVGLRAFAGSACPTAVLERLIKGQRTKRLLQLALVRRHLSQETPELVTATGLGGSFEVLKALPPQILSRIAEYPTFGAWCAAAETLRARGAHRHQPQGQVFSHLRALSGFAVAGALHAGMSVEVEGTVGPDGHLPLPSMGLAVCVTPDLHGRSVTLRTEPRKLSVLQPGATARTFDLAERSTENGGGLVEAARLADLFELNDFDELRTYGQEGAPFVAVGQSERPRWDGAIREALAWLTFTAPASASAVKRFVKVLVPLGCDDPAASASATSESMFGLIHMSLARRTGHVAEILVHEFQHSKLNALMDLQPLLDEGSDPPRHYSPWVAEPRPLRGLLHGVYAFSGVADMWYGRFNANIDRSDREFAEHEFRRRRSETLLAIEELGRHDRLTADGQHLVDTIATRLEKMTVRPTFASLDRTPVERRVAHRLEAGDRLEPPLIERLDARWFAAGGRLCTSAAGGESRAVRASPGLSEICAEFSLPTTVAVHRIDGPASRADTTLARLDLLAVRNPEQLTRLGDQLAPFEGTGAPLAHLLLGHVRSLQGNHRAAGRLYASWVAAVPYGIDGWLDLAAVLRAAGATGPASVIVQRPRLVVTVAARYDLESAPQPGGGHGASPDHPVQDPLDAVLSFLSWLGSAMAELSPPRRSNAAELGASLEAADHRF